MPSLEAFPGLRYDPRRVQLHDVIAPPYDVIEPAERMRLAARHPDNAVLLELPEADEQTGRDRYQVAAALLAAWQSSGLLVADPRPALYPYRMTSPDGERTNGVIGALALAEPGEGDVLPHEETLPKPRSDRLDLLRATAANLSPIWGLTLASGLPTLVEGTTPPAADAVDDGGVRHQLWVVDDPEQIAAVRGAVASAPVVIADGHHRYETALAYRRERRAAAGDRPGAYDSVMAFVVELSEDHLRVGAIHRTLSRVDAGTLPGALGRWFEVVRVGPATTEAVAALGGTVRSGGDAMGLVTADGTYSLVPRAQAYEVAGSDLDSSLVELALRDLPSVESTHRHSWQEAAAAVRDGQADAALFLRPVTVAQIGKWAADRRRMPPKTTYFRPKPRTGMVFRSVSG